ncbi:MAG: tripartite tricarboxylate transporter substrate binding protein [Burkholderiales bacterium]|nr:tripartite tricarboxylate transporter substrate binding protein [Burkholderiales bacterium]
MFNRILQCLMTVYIACSGFGAACAAGEEYPARPVRLIVPFAPGGSTDVIGRALAQKLADGLGTSVVVDNRGGGGGVAGTELAIRAPADGYTLILVSGSYAANAAMYTLAYDPVTDISPVMLVYETAYLATVHPGLKITSPKELIAYASAKPGGLNYGSAGNGSLAHLATELFDLMARSKMTHVPYRGTGPAITDLISGQIQLLLGGVPGLIPHVKSNRIRAIGVTTLRRTRALPDIPSISETLPGYEASLWFGFWGPKGLPGHVAERWRTELQRVVRLPDIQERANAEGLDAVVQAPEEFRRVIQRDILKWREVLKRTARSG